MALVIVKSGELVKFYVFMNVLTLGLLLLQKFINPATKINV